MNNVAYHYRIDIEIYLKQPIIKIIMLQRITLFSFLLLSLISVTSHAQTLRMVSSHWPPYIDNTLAEQGLAAELVTKALQKKGYASTLAMDSWPRALEGVQIGVFDATCAIWKSPERERDLLFSEPFIDNNISFLKKKNTKADYQQLSDLKGFIIGVLRGYAYNDEFTHSSGLMKVPANYMIQNLQKLNQDSIDLVVGDTRVVQHALKQYLPKQVNAFEFISPPLEIKGLYFAVSKGNKDATTIIADFNTAINEMKLDGSYQEITSKYKH